LGIRAIWEPSEFFYAQAAIADAQADKRETGFRTTFHDEDYLVSMAEIGIRPRLFDKDGTYRFILWYDPQDKTELDGSGTKRDDLGFAVSFDQQLTKKVTGFFRYGWADDKVNSTEDFVSFGGQIEGPIEGRSEDVFAVGYARGVRSPDGLSSGDEREIDLIESYYRIEVNKHLQITPNIQFVMDPGGLTSESCAIVFGLRCRVKF
jgi:porin